MLSGLLRTNTRTPSASTLAENTHEGYASQKTITGALLHNSPKQSIQLRTQEPIISSMAFWLQTPHDPTHCTLTVRDHPCGRQPLFLSRICSIGFCGRLDFEQGILQATRIPAKTKPTQARRGHLSRNHKLVWEVCIYEITEQLVWDRLLNHTCGKGESENRIRFAIHKPCSETNTKQSL